MNDVWRSPIRNMVGGVVFVLAVMVLAVIGYMACGWDFGDAAYMVVVTIFTVGYGEVRPVDTPELRAVTIAQIVLGCTGMIFLTGALVQFITIAGLQQMLGWKRMKSRIDHLSDHVIVCGYGRIGIMLARELKAARVSFVVVERAEARFVEAREHGYLCVNADATEEATLIEAGVMRARVLATVLPDDAANVFITLSARSLNKGLSIIARGEVPSTETKLLQAGANDVVLPTHIGAERMAEMILYPGTAGMIRRPEGMRQMERELNRLGLELEVVVAEAGSAFAGQAVGDIERQAGGAFMIVAVERAGGRVSDRPEPAMRVLPGDGVTIIGRGGRAQVVKGFGAGG